MGKFVVFNNIDWKPPIQTKLLSAPVLKLAVDFDDIELKEMTQKQRAAFDAEFKKFDAEFAKLGQAKIKEVQEAVKWTETRIAKKPAKEAEEVVATANKMLAQAFKVFENQIATLAQKHYEASLAKSQQVMKMKITKAKIKAVVKIVVIAGLVLTAAALSIAATVVTGGLAAPVVFAALGVAIKGGITIYQTIDKEWPTVDRGIKVVQADVEALTTATKRLADAKALATTGDPKAMDTLNKVRGTIEGNMVNLDKHVGQLDKFIAQLSRQIQKQGDEWNALAKKVNANGGNKELEQRAAQLDRKTMLAVGALASIGNVKDEAAKVQAAWKANQVLDAGRLGDFAKKLAEAAPVVKEFVGYSKEVVSAGKDLYDAVK